MSSPVLEAVGLTKRFGGVTAVNRVDFRIREGELRCLIGPNGAGKSTFFQCVAGLLKPSEGEIRLRGEDATGWEPHRIAALGVGTKTQVPSLMEGLSVRENIWLAARRRQPPAGARREVDRALQRLELGGVADTAAGRLAHGHRQRVELAAVIAAKPWLILLDEPAAGLTEEETQRMAVIVLELAQQASVIVVEHDMQFVRSIATLVTVFHHGRVLLEDSVDAVMTDQRVRDVYLGAKAR